MELPQQNLEDMRYIEDSMKIKGSGAESRDMSWLREAFLPIAPEIVWDDPSLLGEMKGWLEGGI